MNKKLISGLFFVVLFLVVGSFFLSDISGGDKINVALPNTAPFYSVQWAMDQNHITMSDNVNLEMVPNPSRVKMAFSGKTDIFVIPVNGYFSSQAQNATDLDINCFAAKASAIGVFAQNDSSISSYGDLEGKNIAVPGLKSTSVLIALELLEREGVNGSEINLISKKPAQIPTLVEKGEVDAGLTFGPFYFESKRKLKEVLNVRDKFKEVYGYHLTGLLTVSKASLDEETQGEVISVLDKAIEIGMGNPQKVADFLYETKGIESFGQMEKATSEGTRIYYFEKPNATELEEFRDMYLDRNGGSLRPAEEMLSDVRCT